MIKNNALDSQLLNRPTDSFMKIKDDFRSGKPVGISIVATSSLSIFGYILSKLVKSDLEEPYVLTKLIRAVGITRRKNVSLILAWTSHYLIGLLLTETYFMFRNKFPPHNEIKSGLVFGGLSGLAAILIWKFVLSYNPISPKINFPLFSLNLLLGHMLFGLLIAIIKPDD